MEETCSHGSAGCTMSKFCQAKPLSVETVINGDLEQAPMRDVFRRLHCSEAGLTTSEAESRLRLFGYNKVHKTMESKIFKFFTYMWNPLSWVMEAAAVMAIALQNGGDRDVDWQDFLGILFLLMVNSSISFIEDYNAGNASAALMARLAPTAKVLRNGSWFENDAATLVPGDVIRVKLGDVVPTDVRLMDGDPVEIDQSDLTGEMLPVLKDPGDEVYSGSICKQGEISAVVIATGIHTFFGRAVDLVDGHNEQGHFHRVLRTIGNFCICSITIGIVAEIVVMFAFQHRKYVDGVDNLLVLLIGGIPIAMPTVLSVTMAIGDHRLSNQGVVTKRMTAIEEMASMDILCSDKIGTLTLNTLSVDENLVEVFQEDIDSKMVILLAARASRTENQDATDATIVRALDDPAEARANIREVHFLPFNPVSKRTSITYEDKEGRWWRASKGAPEQILALTHNAHEIAHRVHSVLEVFARSGFRSLAVALQEIPERTKESIGGPWQFCGIMPLLDLPHHDSAETISRAQALGVAVKMITGDQLAIAIETGRRLGIGTNMYPASRIFDDEELNAEKSRGGVLTVDDLIETADGFAGVFPDHKYEIIERLQARRHVVGMVGDGVNDAPALKRADIGIAVYNATDAARSASDIVLTEPGLRVIVNAILTSRSIFQRMKNYTIYAVSITIRIVLGFSLLSLIWEFDFSPFMVLIIAVLNDGTIMTIAKDRVKPSLEPARWKLNEVFTAGIFFGVYLAVLTVIFFWLIKSTSFFTDVFGAHPIAYNVHQMTAAIYLQVSIVSQALIFVTRSRSWSFTERPGVLLMIAFSSAQLVATFIAVYANWHFAKLQGIGWRWAGIIWLYSLISYIPLDVMKFGIRHCIVVANKTRQAPNMDANGP